MIGEETPEFVLIRMTGKEGIIKLVLNISEQQ